LRQSISRRSAVDDLAGGRSPRIGTVLWLCATHRYHELILRSVREVANAVAYVLGNFAIHALRRASQRVPPSFIDPFSSAAPRDTGPPLVREPETWLLIVGFKRAAA
jgi:hypothetical protein